MIQSCLLNIRSSMWIHRSSSSSHLKNLHTCVAWQRTLSIFTCRAVRKIHPTGPAAVHATPSCKWELTACDTFSMLSGDPSTASQSSTGAHTKRTRLPNTTGYVVAPGFLHSLEPQAPLFVGYPADYASCLAIHTVCWTQGWEDKRKLPTSWEVGRKLKEL